MPSNPAQQTTFEKIIPANISWIEDALGNTVPKSELFDDVYYSLVDGLNESRYVFIEQNHLRSRFESLFKDDKNVAPSHFTILELGFGTGLNVLLTWQLWLDIVQKMGAQSSPTDDNATQLKPHRPHLHIISTEKYPLTHADLTRSLSSWKKRDASLTPFIDTLLSLYPALIAGCHRLHLGEHITLDLWFGDALDSLTALDTGNINIDNLVTGNLVTDNKAYIDAWYLDGFAPSCNETLWTTQIFAHMQRLSKVGSTASTFSCAGVVKRGLRDAGFAIEKVAGFGIKKHMLTATFTGFTDTKCSDGNSLGSDNLDSNSLNTNIPLKQEQNTSNSPASYQHIAIIGAGIAGLMSAWALARRGIAVTLYDKTAPLAGASGNPRALLAPKMTPISHVAEHLHTISYLYSSRFYRQLDALHTSLDALVFEPTTTLDLLLKSNVDTTQISDYPASVAQVLNQDKAQTLTGLKHQNLTENLYLPQSGLINPKAIADIVLSHPHIKFQQAEIKNIAIKNTVAKNIATKNVATKDTVTKNTVTKNTDISDDLDSVRLTYSNSNDSNANTLDSNTESNTSITADAVIIATAYSSHSLDARIFDFRKIRGQLSWFEPSHEQLQALPKVPLKYAGYCALFTPSSKDSEINPVAPHTPTFLLGASFVRNDLSTEIRHSEHAINLEKLMKAVPELREAVAIDDNINNGFEGWQARVGIRAQTPDYHPVVGQVDTQGKIWTISGMGSKGYAFAPLCAEALADMMTSRFPPLSNTMIKRLSPHRKSLSKPLSQD